MNSLVETWFAAIRPKTLPASASPVIMASALAWRDGGFKIVPCLLALIIALIAQIAANIVNDYYDYVKGADTPNRVGPKRAASSGMITPAKLYLAAAGLMFAAILLALILVYYGGALVIIAGVLVCAGVFAYSGGPYPLAYHGLGDIAVILFYGLIPVTLTYYLQTGVFTADALFLSLSIGFAVENILLVNNYRDYEEDKATGKNTTIVIFGRNTGPSIYVMNVVISCLCALMALGSNILSMALLIYAVLVVDCVTNMRTSKGSALNEVLGKTARNVLIFALLVTVVLIN
jgi:1,4-dihydroxy-2-naphthoate octaprenyltransferase